MHIFVKKTANQLSTEIRSLPSVVCTGMCNKLDLSVSFTGPVLLTNFRGTGVVVNVNTFSYKVFL